MCQYIVQVLKDWTAIHAPSGLVPFKLTLIKRVIISKCGNHFVSNTLQHKVASNGSAAGYRCPHLVTKTDELEYPTDMWNVP